jgi:RNA polymerase sigma-70 factor (ECF subfamily)
MLNVHLGRFNIQKARRDRGNPTQAVARRAYLYRWEGIRFRLAVISRRFARYSNNGNPILTAQDRSFLASTSTLKHESNNLHFAMSVNHWTAREPVVNRESATTGTALGPDLIKRAQEGDSAAFGALFQAHRSRIYSVCLRMTSNAAEAEDLTQDTFLQVFRKISKFRGDSAFSTWLHRIAVNTVLMHFRKNSLNLVSLDEPLADTNGAKKRREIGTRDKGLAGCIDRVALARAMQQLPPGYRTIFLLHEVEGYEHQEIAEMLSCSVGNSKSQLYKARLRFRELLAHSPEAQFAIRKKHLSTQKRAQPNLENWLLPIGAEALIPPTPPVAQLRPQAA